LADSSADPCKARAGRSRKPDAADKRDKLAHAGGYRPWAELLARTFAVDVLACPRCQGRMKLLCRGPPYWKSRVLRLKVLGDEDEGAGRGQGAGEEVA
jgi:hypothetical protein